jgi:hypothetical protein
MNKDIHTEEKVNRALASLDNLQRAKANPFLYEKISARMKEPGQSKSFGPKFIFAAVTAMILMLLLNFSVWKSYDSSVNYSKETTTTHTGTKQNISTFTQEYFNQNSTYSY